MRFRRIAVLCREANSQRRLANPTTFSYPYRNRRSNIPKYEKNFRQSGEEGFGGVHWRFFPAVVPPLAAAHVKGSVVCSSNAAFSEMLRITTVFDSGVIWPASLLR